MSQLSPANDSGLMKTKLFGAVLIPAGLVGAYFWIWRPLVEARHTGELHYYVKGVLLPAALIYFGVALLVTDLRQDQVRRINAQGKPTLTRKGWLFIVGLFVVLGVTLAAWYAYLKSIGFQAI